MNILNRPLVERQPSNMCECRSNRCRGLIIPKEERLTMQISTFQSTQSTDKTINQINYKKYLLKISQAQAWTSSEINCVKKIMGISKEFLFNLTDKNESFFDLVHQKCNKMDLTDLISEMLEDVDTLNTYQIDKLKNLLFLTKPSTPNFFTLLMERENANQLFDHLLQFMTSDEINENHDQRISMLSFANSKKRYDYIFLKAENLSSHTVADAEECYKNCQLDLPNSIQAEYETNHTSHYLEWLSKRSQSSTSILGQSESNAKCFSRWLVAQRLCSELAVQHRHNVSDVSWSFIKKLHIALCEGELGIDRPGQLRQEIARTSGGGAHFFSVIGLSEHANDLLEWFNAGLRQAEQKQLNPIIFAAQSYQRFVSLHPFENGNGRLSRLMMDYVLERFKLPPPILGKNILDAVFPMDISNQHQDEFVKKIITGIEKSKNELVK